MTSPARLKLRLYFSGDHSLGPGKVALLEAVEEQGSISAAARSMGMAYRHAWVLIDDLNQCFGEPVVATATGGRSGGGARLTPLGAEIVRRFRAIDSFRSHACHSGARPAVSAPSRRAEPGAGAALAGRRSRGGPSWICGAGQRAPAGGLPRGFVTKRVDVSQGPKPALR